MCRPLSAAFLLLSCAIAAQAKRIIVCDAGSTGTRVYVYSVEDSGALTATSLSKVRPGLSTFGDHPQDATSYLLPLFAEARDFLKGEDLSSVEVYIMATAGMRLLSKEQQEDVWDAVYKGLTRAGKDRFPFTTRPGNLATITGETEGYFAALATNQLAGLIDSKGRPTSCSPHAATEADGQPKELLGALDLGGSSTQIIFPKAGAGCAEILQQLRGSPPRDPIPGPIRLSDFWTNSYLGYGAEKASEKIMASIVSEQGGFDPCTNAGYSRQVAGQMLEGSGNAPQCRQAISKALFGPAATACDAAPGGEACSLLGINVPARAKEVQYLAMSVYFYAMDCVRTLVEIAGSDMDGASPAMSWPTPSIAEMKRVVDFYCAIPWAQGSPSWIKEDGKTVHPFTDADSLPDTCLRSNYIIVLLEDVYGIPSESQKVTIVQEFHGEEVEWTRGAAISVLAGTHAETVQVVPGTPFYGVSGNNLLIFGIAVLLLVWAGLEYNKRRNCRKSGIPGIVAVSQKGSV